MKQTKALRPVWVRAPAIGVEHFTGLTRAKLYQLDALGLIESRAICDPGKVRGCRLFNLESILRYIDESKDSDL